MKAMRISQSFILLIVLLTPGGLGFWQAKTSGNTSSTPQDATNVDYIGHIGGKVTTIAVDGDYAYIGEGYALTILDITASGAPQVVGRTGFLPDIVQDVALAGGYAYLADREGGMRVVDISDPTKPFEAGSAPYQTYQVAVSGEYAYLGGVDGLRIINISDPANPSEVIHYESSRVFGLTTTGNYLYLAAGDLLVIDVSNPGNPIEIGSYETAGDARDVTLVGSYAYVADWDNDLRVIDISDPTNPVEVTYTDLPGYTDVIEVMGSHAYAISWGFMGPYSVSYLTAIDISDPLNLKQDDSWSVWEQNINGLAVSGDFAYLAAGDMYVIDISDPEDLVPAGYYSIPDYFKAVVISGDFAYLAAGNVITKVGIALGLWVFDISNPALLSEVASFLDGDDYVVGMAIKGSMIYTADEWGGLRVIDISDPTNPSLRGFYTFYGGKGVDVLGDYAYVAGGDAGLRVVDVSDPGDPFETGVYDTAGDASDVTVVGQYAYLADGEAGLRTIDVSDPANPDETGSYNTPHRAESVSVVGGYAYVADGEAGLRVIDVSDPANPSEVGFCDTPGWAVNVVVSGGYAYVADGEAGLRVIDVSDPFNPFEAGYYDTPGNARNLAVAGSYVIVADWEGGIIVLNHTGVKDDSSTTTLSDRPDPSLVGGPFTVRVEVGAGFGMPSGQVDVTVEGERVGCKAELVSGTGSCQITLMKPGSYTLTASYSGDKYFLPSTAAAINHTVVTPVLHYLPLMGGGG